MRLIKISVELCGLLHVKRIILLLIYYYNCTCEYNLRSEQELR